YSQMLKDAIDARKAGKTYEEAKPFEVELNLELDAYIPSSYIEDEKQKIDMYKRFQSISDLKDIEDIEDELIDRFGDYPEEVSNLITVSKLKLLAKKERIESLFEQKMKIELVMEE